VLISVGALVERKGFHRVIELLPYLRQQERNLVYLVVGGPSPEGDWRERLETQVAKLGVQENVRFLGAVSPQDLKVHLSAADVFVLATRNEGWANVFLEAMACGLPVVTTDVGGNREVVCDESLGMVVPFERPDLLRAALEQALSRVWDRSRIIAHARSNAWDGRIADLLEELRQVAALREPRLSG
jgi:glycosyltransferase involved in cell wall biosynthesis